MSGRIEKKDDGQDVAAALVAYIEAVQAKDKSIKFTPAEEKILSGLKNGTYPVKNAAGPVAAISRLLIDISTQKMVDKKEPAPSVGRLQRAYSVISGKDEKKDSMKAAAMKKIPIEIGSLAEIIKDYRAKLHSEIAPVVSRTKKPM